MLALLKPISDTVPTPNATQLNAFLANDYNGSGTLSYNSNISDSKVTYNPTDATSIFGRYSINPFSVTDPQELGQAGGGTFDGGQPGAASGRIQNVGLGMSHVITPHMVIDADFQPLLTPCAGSHPVLPGQSADSRDKRRSTDIPATRRACGGLSRATPTIRRQ